MKRKKKRKAEAKKAVDRLLKPATEKARLWRKLGDELRRQVSLRGGDDAE